LIRKFISEAFINKNLQIEINNFGLLLIVLCGVFCTYLPLGSSAIWGVATLLTVYYTITQQKDKIWYIVALTPGLEVFSRLTNAPIVPFEIGKYFLTLPIAALLLLNVSNPNKPKNIWVSVTIISALVPSIVYSLFSGFFEFSSWLFNITGILQLATLTIAASKECWTINKFTNVLKILVLPIVMITLSVILKSPKFDEIDFSLTANTKASGGFGSNQVSTILGLGIAVLFLLILLKQRLFKLKIVNFIMLGLMIFRGLLTFSRGGVLVAILAVIVAVLYFLAVRKNPSEIAMFVGGIFVCAILFVVTNMITGNTLLLRYKGETKGTAEGTRKKDLSTLTSGRSEIANSDLRMFEENPVWGVGIGQSKVMRPKYGYKEIIAHVEFSRLVAEHGIGGLIVIIVVTFFPLARIFRVQFPPAKLICIVFFILSIGTTFHAAMRTAVTPVLFSLACFTIVKPKQKHLILS
jgi:O-Antigen ligase